MLVPSAAVTPLEGATVVPPVTGLGVVGMGIRTGLFGANNELNDAARLLFLPFAKATTVSRSMEEGKSTSRTSPPEVNRYLKADELMLRNVARA